MIIASGFHKFYCWFSLVSRHELLRTHNKQWEKQDKTSIWSLSHALFQFLKLYSVLLQLLRELFLHNHTNPFCVTFLSLQQLYTVIARRIRRCRVYNVVFCGDWLSESFPTMAETTVLWPGLSFSWHLSNTFHQPFYTSHRKLEVLFWLGRILSIYWNALRHLWLGFSNCQDPPSETRRSLVWRNMYYHDWVCATCIVDISVCLFETLQTVIERSCLPLNSLCV